MSTLGQTMKALRLEQALTQEDLAGRLFVTRQTISNWENGKSNPDYDQLAALAEHLGTEVTVLLGEPQQTPRRTRRQRWILAALGLLSLLFVLSQIFLKPELMRLAYRTFLPHHRPYLLAVQPVGTVIVTLFVLSVLTFRPGWRLRNRRTRAVCLWLAGGILLLYCVGVGGLFLPFLHRLLPLPLAAWNFAVQCVTSMLPFGGLGGLLFFGLRRGGPGDLW